MQIKLIISHKPLKQVFPGTYIFDYKILTVALNRL